MQTMTTTSHLPPSSAPGRSQPKPIVQDLTLDLLQRLLSRSLLHPFICFLIPLCLLALHRPASSAGVRNTFFWACGVTLWRTLEMWNHRLAYGSAREVVLEEEVVLVAGGGGGGGGGLGRLMVEAYAMKGARGVVVLDLHVPEEGPEREEWEDRGVRWYRCDVANREEVERVRELVVEEFDTHPTILINCIAAPIVAQPITSLTTAQFTTALNANLVSHFNLISVFLPSMIASAQGSSSTTTNVNKHPEEEKEKENSETTQKREKTPKGGATIVTISSILSHLSPAHLSPYNTSKSALTSLHETLHAELLARNLIHQIKPLLVQPGHIGTSLFASVLPPDLTDAAGSWSGWARNFVAPTLDTTDVCKVVAGLVDAGEGGTVAMPGYAALVSRGGWAVVPAAVQRLTRAWTGLDRVVVVGGVE